MKTHLLWEITYICDFPQTADSAVIGACAAGNSEKGEHVSNISNGCKLEK